MKTTKLKIAIAIVTLFITISASAQDTIDAVNFNPNKFPPKGSVIVERSFNPYVGTWLFTSKDTEIIVRLEKKAIVFRDSTLMLESLIGGYKYSKNGQTVDNTLDEKPIFARVDRDKNQVILTVTDRQTFKGSLFTAILTNPKTLLLKANDGRGEGIKRDPKLNFLDNAIFVKIK